MGRAVTWTAGPIYALLLSLVMADANRLDKNGGCIDVQQRLAKLRAEIEEVEAEAHEACSTSVGRDAARRSPHLGETAFRVVRAVHVLPSLGDANSTDLQLPGGRLLQTSGTTHPST